MIAAAAAGSSPIGAGLGGPVPGPVGAAERDGAELDRGAAVVESAVADMHAARTTSATTKGRPRTRWLLIIRRTMRLPLLFGALGGLVAVIEITFYSTDHELRTEVATLIGAVPLVIGKVLSISGVVILRRVPSTLITCWLNDCR
jgi:hypothetical protein